MRRFIKGLLAGTLLSALAKMAFKPSRKPGMWDMINRVDGDTMRRRTRKALKGARKTMDKMMK